MGMLLHEAIKNARQDLRLSQKKLSEMAGIQRRQLATLESGGNVTLATLRKVLVHLPNLETFTLDAVTATVRREVSRDEKQKAVEEAMGLLATGFQSLVAALKDGRLPDPDALRDLRQANNVLYQGLGYSQEDLDRDRAQLAAEREAEEAAAFDAMRDAILGPDEGDEDALEEEDPDVAEAKPEQDPLP